MALTNRTVVADALGIQFVSVHELVEAFNTDASLRHELTTIH